jgi:hypothetical protein
MGTRPARGRAGHQRQPGHDHDVRREAEQADPGLADPLDKPGQREARGSVLPVATIRARPTSVGTALKFASPYPRAAPGAVR